MEISAVDFREIRRLQKLVLQCEQLWNPLRDEATEAPFVTWPEKINVGGWSVAGVRWQGEDSETAKEKMPFLNQIVQKHDRIILNAGYSKMDPKAMILPHIGYTKEVLRLHFGLIVPAGNCGLRVGEKEYRWKAGEALLFDDTKEHSAWNDTDEARTIIIFDIIRGKL